MSGMPPPPGEPAQQADAPQQDALRDEVANLHEALRSQRDIGMAIGLMSARFGMSVLRHQVDEPVAMMSHRLLKTGLGHLLTAVPGREQPPRPIQ